MYIKHSHHTRMIICLGVIVRFWFVLVVMWMSILFRGFSTIYIDLALNPHIPLLLILFFINKSYVFKDTHLSYFIHFFMGNVNPK